MVICCSIKKKPVHVVTVESCIFAGSVETQGFLVWVHCIKQKPGTYSPGNISIYPPAGVQISVIRTACVHHLKSMSKLSAAAKLSRFLITERRSEICSR